MVDLDHSVLSTGQVSNVLGDARQALASQLRTGLQKRSRRRYVKLHVTVAAVFVPGVAGYVGWLQYSSFERM